MVEFADVVAGIESPRGCALLGYSINGVDYVALAHDGAWAFKMPIRRKEGLGRNRARLKKKLRSHCNGQ